MNFPIPDFVPVPNAEIMQTISIVSLIVGICLVGVGLLFQFLKKKKGKEKKALKKTAVCNLIVGTGLVAAGIFFFVKILCVIRQH